MSDQILGILKDYWPVLIPAFVLFVILIFFTKFFIQALLLRKTLADALKALGKVKDRTGGKVVELDEIDREVMIDSRLTHLWREYAKTLHPQKEKDNLGQIRIVRWRATALAESFFSEQALIDIPLKTEFYKHLPGILTGVGIIGTFSGLILGLSKFHVSSKPEEAQSALNGLINSVYHAFIVSGIAITLAMLFTWIEKSLITGRYKQVEALRQLIDSLFDAGVGEEYLEKLVKATETSATQVVQIKDALVADLKEILTDIAAQHTNQIGDKIGAAIGASLAEPFKDISIAVGRVGANQGEAVNKMLTDVLTSFSSQMQDMFGGQMRGMSELLQQTAQAMQMAVGKFDQLAANMGSAGKGAVDAMGERLNQAMDSMEARQQILNRQMGEFVEQIKTMVSESQTQASQKLQETLAKLGEQVFDVELCPLLGYPDEKSRKLGQRRRNTTYIQSESTRGTETYFTQPDLLQSTQSDFEFFVAKHSLHVVDQRSKGGALWVLTTNIRQDISKALENWGFHYKAGRGWWKE